MKSNLLGLLFLGLSLFVLTPAFAQISITLNDVASYYTIGNVITERYDTLDFGEGMFNIGSPGGGNTWDFSGVSLDGIESQMVVDPSGTPASSDFPDANVALFFDIDEDGVTGNLYNYFILGNNSLTLLGSSGSSSSEGFNITTTITNSPVQPVFQFPINFEDTWTYEGKQVISSSVDGTPLPASEDDVKDISVVDAYGTIIFPDGSSTAALRVKQTSIFSSEIIPGFPVVDTSYNFSFITKTGTILSIGYTGDGPSPDQGSIQGSLSWSASGQVSSVVDLEAAGFRLESPQTHPVLNVSLVKYTLPESENIRISLFDLQGREVKVLTNGLQAAGDHRLQLDATELSSGAYFMSLMTRGGVMTQKVIVQK